MVIILSRLSPSQLKQTKFKYPGFQKMNNPSPLRRGSGRSSIFQRDLSSPSLLSRNISQKNGGFSTPAQQAAASALLRDNFGGGSATPPPPIFTLDECPDIIMTSWDYTPESKSTPLRPTLSHMNIDEQIPNYSSFSPVRSGFGSGLIETTKPTTTTTTQGITMSGLHGAQQGPSDCSWWYIMKDESRESGEKGLLDMSRVVQQQQHQSGGLLTLPAPREIVRPEIPRGNLNDIAADDEEWVTVFGFSPSDTNLVLREFEKCGVILKHVSGPGDANWMHILYQNHYDAQKALQKNGMQINGILIIGVKYVDPRQRMALTEKTNNSLMILPPESHGRALAVNPSTKALSRPYYLQSNEPIQRPQSTMASPSKSTISKIVDLMFGI